MAQFKDQNDKTWTLALDGPKIRKIRELCKVDPVALDGKFWLAMEDDPLIIFDSCYVLCEDQLGPVTVEQFYKALTGDATERAAKALEAAIIDFFPTRKREILTALLQRYGKVREMQLERAEGLIPKVDQQIEELRSKLMSSDSATSGPVSAESDPTGSPSENSTG